MFKTIGRNCPDFWQASCFNFSLPKFWRDGIHYADQATGLRELPYFLILRCSQLKMQLLFISSFSEGKKIRERVRSVKSIHQLHSAFGTQKYSQVKNTHRLIEKYGI